jgi:hypothetical protein
MYPQAGNGVKPGAMNASAGHRDEARAVGLVSTSERADVKEDAGFSPHP